MALQIGIIGLPNVGKSTLFNALTQTQEADVANYPFCTIEPNQAVVPIPDPRLVQLGNLVAVENVIHTTIEFLDIAGLVEGASRGEGLGNKFLGHIRSTDALIHVVRCFEDPSIIHVREKPDPMQDVEIIQTELILADLEQLEKKIEKLKSEEKGKKGSNPLRAIAEQCINHLQEGFSLRSFEFCNQPDFKILNKELQFLTFKPVIYAANLAEDDLQNDLSYLHQLDRFADREGSQVIKISAQLESEVVNLNPAERQEYLKLAGIEFSGLNRVIQTGYKMLNLISFFTYNQNETRAWTVPAGATAPEAAGKIHTDFQRGFIKAEVIPFDVFVEYGSAAAVREAGKLQIEGKDYQVQDGDVILFRFNV
jgi:GTP-binding protein YchF